MNILDSVVAEIATLRAHVAALVAQTPHHVTCPARGIVGPGWVDPPSGECNCTLSNPDLARLVREQEARGAVIEAAWAVADGAALGFDDERLSYLELQIERSDWTALAGALRAWRALDTPKPLENE